MSVYVLSGSCPKTSADLRDEMADEHDEKGEPVRAEWYRMVARKMRREGDTEPRSSFDLMFWHERGEDATVVCPCGHFSEYLCDEPIGLGRSCDKPMCRCCRTSIGPELDRCGFHVAAMSVSA